MGAATLAASLAAGLAVGLAFEAGLPGHCSLAPPSLQTYLVGFGFLFAGDVMVFALGFCAYFTPRAVTFLLAIVLCASPAVLPPILEIAKFIATLREVPFSASDAMIGLFVSASMIVLAGFRVLAHAAGETPGDAAKNPESWCLYLISATARRGKDGRALAPPPGFLPRTVAVLLLRVAYLGLCVSVLRIGGAYRPTAHALGGRGFFVDAVDDVLATATVAAFLAPVLEIAGLLLKLSGQQPIDGFKDPILRSTSPLDLWGRRWNLHVHAILKIGFYKPLVKIVPKAIASVATFVASALYHEIVFAVAFPSYTVGRSTLFFALQGVICAGQLGLDAVGAPFKDLPAPLKTLGTLCLLGPTAYLFVDIWRDDGMFESMGALTWVMKCEAEAPPPPPSKFLGLF